MLLKNIRKSIFLALTVTIIFTVNGCSEHQMSDLQRYVDAEKVKPAGRIRPVPEFKAYDSYIYVVDKNSRSPFESNQQEELLPDVSDSGLTPDRGRHKESLENFPLDTLKYAGSLERGGKMWAIIISPDSLIHKINVGNYIGQNYGKIIKITDSSIEISELVTNGMGGWIERLAGLSMVE